MNQCYQLEPWKQTWVKSNWSKYKLFIHKNAFENVVVSILSWVRWVNLISKEYALFVFLFLFLLSSSRYSAVWVKHWFVKAKLAHTTHRLWHWNVQEFILFFSTWYFCPLYCLNIFFMSRSLTIGWILVILEKCYQMMSPRWYHQSGHLKI